MHKPLAILTITLSLAGCCCFQSAGPAPPAQGNFTQIDVPMTQAEVRSILGPPAAIRAAKFPEGQFMGPQEGMIGVIAPGQAYEEWEYLRGGEVILIFFAGENFDDPHNQWNVVGKTRYPQGAVF